MLLERTKVDDELVRARPVLAGVQNVVRAPEARSHVVRVQNCKTRRLLQAGGSQHLYVHPRDGQDARAAEGRRGDGTATLRPHVLAFAAHLDDRMTGQEGRQVLGHSNGPDARSAAPVGDAEGLVEVQVADVRADEPRRREADLGIHVGPVHVDLPSMGMNQIADVLDTLLEDAVRAGVRDHEGAEPVRVLLGLGLEVVEVDVPALVALDHDHLHATHDRGGRIGSMCADRNEADVAMALAVRFLILANREQARVLSLRAAVRLRRARGEAGDLGKILVQALDELGVALPLVVRCERVDVGELGPRHGDHLRGGVQLHGARSEADHRRVQRQILVLERLQVAQHLRFGVMRVEHGMLHEGRHPAQAAKGTRCCDLRHRRVELRFDVLDSEAAEHGEHGLRRVRLAEADAKRIRANSAHVDAFLQAGVEDARSVLGPALHHEGVKESGRADVEAIPLEDGPRRRRKQVHATCDALQALGAVIDAVRCSHVGQERLRRADVAGRLVPPDVLLAGLHRHSERGVPLAVNAHADQAAGQAAGVLVPRRDEARMRPAEPQRHPEALRGADGDVGADVPGALQQREREEIRRADHKRPVRMARIHQFLVVQRFAEGVGVLHEHAGVRLVREVGLRDVSHHDFDAARVATGLDESDGLRMAIFGHEELAALLGDRNAHVHGLGGCGCLVQERGVGDLHAGEVGHHRLEVQQHLQAALRDLRLVGRVGRVPARILQHVAQHHGRRDGLVVSHADQVRQHLVALRDAPESLQRRLLRQRLLQVQIRREADMRRHRGVNEVVQVVEANHLRNPVPVRRPFAHLRSTDRPASQASRLPSSLALAQPTPAQCLGLAYRLAAILWTEGRGLRSRTFSISSASASLGPK
mmetsp:Transcript_6016/g.23375  ORF Transcript_6016/g.23375 Transcript_6016/m.23375 type:complete len:875 (+) Transcript_6016:760-3384(+)